MIRIVWNVQPVKREGRNIWDQVPAPVWPEGWPVPRIGDEIARKDGGGSRTVTSVIWYPAGEFSDTAPFVYIVLK